MRRMIAPLIGSPGATDKDTVASVPLIALFLTAWAALVKALAVAARPERATCARCGRPHERRRLGEHVCRCRL